MLARMSVTWTTAMLDLPAGAFEAAVGFWCRVAGTRLSPSRGPRDEFRTLLPAEGDPVLKVQRLGAGPPRLHLDLHTDDPAALAARAAGLGATRLAAHEDYTTWASPHGLVFCVVDHPAARPPAPVDWGTHRSVVDQVCLDIPSARFDAEAAFWAALLERALQDSPGYAEFARLERAPADPVRFLLQRCGFEGPARAHLDLATTDRTAEVDRVVALGAGLVRVTDGWTTLRDPAGLELCVTDREPRRGSVTE
jgi:hypothetical protein